MDPVADPGEVTPASAPAPADPIPPISPGASAYRVIPASQIVEAGMIQVNDKYITLGQVLHPIRRDLMAAGTTTSTK